MINVEGKNVKLQVWDTVILVIAPLVIHIRPDKSPLDQLQDLIIELLQVRYLFMTSRGSNSTKSILNMVRRETFTHLTRWLDEARQNGNPQMSFILVGNKCDMEGE